MEVIYSDEDIIVVNKPPGISVHGGPQVRGKTLVDFLLEQFPEIQNVGDDPAVRPGIVHRLDKDTSGVMVIARTQKSFEELKKMFQERRVEKTYRAIVCGIVKKQQGVIDFPIGRLAKNPLKRGTGEGRAKIRGARDAATEYHVLKQGNDFSLLELFPKTGRMHQIRVHMKALGYPVACDHVYGGKSGCCPAGVSRQLLHASAIAISLQEGKRLRFEADPPDDFLVAEKSIF